VPRSWRVNVILSELHRSISPGNLLHVRNGALAHECDGYGVGANAVASAAGRRVASAAQRKRREGGWTIAAKTWIGAETLDRMSRNAY